MPNVLTNVCFHPYTHREIRQGCSSTNSFITCGWSPRSHFRSFVWVRAMGKNRGGNKRNRLIKETQSVAVLKPSSLDKDAKVGIPSKWQSIVHSGSHPFQKALNKVNGSIVNSFSLAAHKSAITNCTMPRHNPMIARPSYPSSFNNTATVPLMHTLCPLSI